MQHEYQWTVQSLDLVLGLVGGFVSLIWGTLNIVLGGYQAFKLENSLIGAVYPTSPQGRDSNERQIDGDENDQLQSEDLAKRVMFTTVAERGKYWYNYSEYLTIRLLSAVCCCFVSGREWYNRRLKRLYRHQEAS